MSSLVESKPRTFSGGAPLAAKSEGVWADAWHRLIRNKAAVVGSTIIIILFLSAIFANFIAPKPYDVQVLQDQNKTPQWIISIFPSMKSYAKTSTSYLWGADYVGRDLFSRLLYGARVSLSVAVIGPLISLLIGVLY